MHQFVLDRGNELWMCFDRGNELWVMLLEKAMAKLCGGYRQITSGSSGEAFAYLTGSPVTVFRFDQIPSPLNLWPKLVEFGDNGTRSR